MKHMKDIASSKAVTAKQLTDTWLIGYITLPCKKGKKEASLVVSIDKDPSGAMYEHASIAPLDHTIPTWEQMCFLKDTVWNDEEECYQVFPKKSEYVNIKDNCLHIWRRI